MGKWTGSDGWYTPLTVFIVIANEKHAYSTPCCTPTSSTTPEWEHSTNDPTGTTQIGEDGRTPESSAHTSFEACGKACHGNADCLSYTYSSSGHCFFIRSMRLGDKRPVNPEDRQTAGWDLEKMQKWRESHRCERAQWVKPSLSRIF